MTENEITSIILDRSIAIHKALGPGLLESVYETCLFHELSKASLKVQRQKAMPLVYDGIHMESGYRIDLMVEEKVIVEVKSVEGLNDLHPAQTLTYLRLSDCKVGLLINFNVSLLKNGFRRIVNNY
jgi:GxxExxY protein